MLSPGDTKKAADTRGSPSPMEEATFRQPWTQAPDRIGGNPQREGPRIKGHWERVLREDEILVEVRRMASDARRPGSLSEDWKGGRGPLGTPQREILEVVGSQSFDS